MNGIDKNVPKAKLDLSPRGLPWGITLSKENDQMRWVPDPDFDDCFIGGTHVLALHHIILGHEVQPGEVNVVEITGPGYKEDVKLPLLVATGGIDITPKRLSLMVGGPVLFRLLEGNGPVHITGLQLVRDYQLK